MKLENNQPTDIRCYYCNGLGVRDKQPCKYCEGTGQGGAIDVKLMTIDKLKAEKPEWRKKEVHALVWSVARARRDEAYLPPDKPWPLESTEAIGRKARPVRIKPI